MNLNVVRGEQYPIIMDLLDNDGNKIEQSEISEITMTCRKLPEETSEILFQKKLSNDEITYDSEEQAFVIELLEEDTKDLEYGSYGYDIKVESGDVIEKFVGSLIVKEEYTMGYANESE